MIPYSFRLSVTCKNTSEAEKMKEISGEGGEMGEVGRSVKYTRALASTLRAKLNKSQPKRLRTMNLILPGRFSE